MRIAQIVVAGSAVALTVTYGFGSVLLILALIAALYLLIVIILPIIVRTRVRMIERPAVHPVEYGDPSIPETARVQLQAHREALIALDFEARGVIHQPAGPAQPAYLALFQHPHGACALARVMMTPGKGPPTVQSADVEFDVRYEDGTIVELSNVPAVAHGLHQVPGIARQMAHVRDVARLFDYFIKLVARYELTTGMSSRDRVPLSDDDTVATVYYDEIEKSYAVQHRAGLLSRTRVPGTWQPTWRYAFMIAAGLVSPGAEFARRRLHSRGERLRRDLDGDATQTTAERIGTRHGWLLMSVGIVLTVMTAVTSLVGSSMAFLGMVAVWWLVKRRGDEPDWRAILLGGAAAMLFLAVPVAALEYAFPFGAGVFPLSVLLATIQAYVFPIVVLTLAAALLVEGFRAAAT